MPPQHKEAPSDQPVLRKEQDITAIGNLALQTEKSITSFSYPENLAAFSWKGDLSSAKDDFSKACSDSGAEFTILKGSPGQSSTAESSTHCLVKIRGFERQAMAEERENGISKVEIISSNLWIGGEMACRTDMTIRFFSDGRIIGDMMTVTANLDKSDPQVCEMDQATRYDAEGNPVLNGFWSNRKLSYHAHDGGTIESAGRTLLAIHTEFGKARGMTSFHMRAPTEHERRIVQEYYLSLGATVRYVGADTQEPFGLEISGLDKVKPMPTVIYERQEPWKPEADAPSQQ